MSVRDNILKEKHEREDEQDKENGKFILLDAGQENTVIEGRLVELREFKGSHGKMQYAVILQHEDGSRMRLQGRTILVETLAEHVQDGEAVKIKYLGKVPGKSYHNYEVDKQDASGNWVRITAKGREEA